MTSPKFNLTQKIRWVRLLVKGFFSSFEKDTANAILQMSNAKNPVILDIGANIGLFTKRLHAQVANQNAFFHLSHQHMFMKF